jgi:hypothetical protein
VLNSVIQQTYAGEKPEKYDILEAFSERVNNYASIDAKDSLNFFRKHFNSLYYDSLLLLKEHVRTYCQKNQKKQARRTARRWFEDEADTVAPAVHPPPQPPVAPTSAAEIPSTSPIQPSAELVSNTGIQVSRTLWEGKTPPTVREAMRRAGFDDWVIAYVLYEWCGLKNDKAIGTLLFVSRNPADPERGTSEAALRRRSQALRKEASTFTITTDP